jgi:uncharacterized ferritin-like protein (DUF455 family)
VIIALYGMNFYKELESILEIKTPAEKISKFKSFYEIYITQNINMDDNKEIKKFDFPSYVPLCKVVSPQIVPKRKNLTTKEGQKFLLHAIAHIEYSAIDLALDATYRFRGLPKKYYDDWLEVADDEVKHFLMLEKLLNKLDINYGDIEVHNALFEASQRTQTLLERMAVVPRFLEANGLDATPLILKKLNKLPKSKMIEDIISNLHIILKEEIDHVKKGDIWFNYACKIDNKSPDIYFDIIHKYYPQGFLRAKNLNIDGRKEAGFSCDELKIMAHKKVC